MAARASVMARLMLASFSAASALSSAASAEASRRVNSEFGCLRAAPWDRGSSG